MSTRTLRYTALYNELVEAIDFEKAEALTLKLNQGTRFEVERLDVGIKIERFPEGGEGMFKPGSILYDKFNSKTYYNLGFDIEDSTVQTYKTNYRTLAKILGVVVKSTLEWIKQNKPEVVTIVPTGKGERESDKKLSIYASILQGNQTTIDKMGYYWDRIKFLDKPGLYIGKKP